MTSTEPARYAVVGHPVAHSQSPFIHQQFAQQSGLSLVYSKIEAPLDGFVHIVNEFFAAGGHGLNITVPFKQDAYTLALQNLSQRARVAGAVNTLWQRDGQLYGCNTDGAGLVTDLQRLDYGVQDQRILLLGSGGAARGAAPSLLQAGCSVLHIANRTASKAHQLCDDLTCHFPEYADTLSAGGLTDIDGEWDIVINATSSSLDSATRLDACIQYAHNALAYDMVYGAAGTPFMEQARHDGAAQIADGLGMLVGQAAVSFAIWHGVQPDIDPVLLALRQHIAC